MVARAIKACYLAARAEIPDADKLRSAGLARLIAQLSGGARVLDLIRSGHKVQWSADQINGAEVLRRSGRGGKQFLVLPKIYDGWFGSPLQADLVLNKLDRLGLLLKDRPPPLKTLQAKISGVSSRRRYYAIREAVLRLS